MKLMNVAAALLLFFISLGTATAEDIQKDRFHVVDNSIVIDSKTGLMWSLQDNGKDIDWWDAEKFSEDFTAGGYDDWRLPDIKELATLYTDGENNKDGYSIAEPIKITDCCIWSSYDVLGAALTFSFKSGNRVPVSFAETYQLRVLPVRGTSKIDLKKHKNF